MVENEPAPANGEDDVRALLTRAVQLRDAGRLEESAGLARRAAEAAPQHAGARHLLGVLAIAQGNLAEAEAELQRAVELSPGLVAAHVNLARARYGQGRAERALAAYDAALALEPHHSEALGNRAMALAALGRHEAALEGVAAALALRPDEPLLHLARGNSYAALGRFVEARDAYDRAAKLQPGLHEAVWNRGLASLALGDFATGWDDYERRWQVAAFVEGSRGCVTPELIASFRPVSAKELADARVLVVAEQGVGDVIMFASVLPDLAAVAARVTLVCDPRLATLIAHSMPAVEVRADLPDEAEFDHVLPLGSLPRLLRRTAGDFPGTPYLAPTAAARARAAQVLGPADGQLRVGLSWRGGTLQTRTRERSVDLAALRPVLALPGCDIVSLQYGDVAAEIAAEGGALRTLPAEDLADFDRLAAIVEALDLVVSVQTAVVHLAGAVGTSCVVMTPARPEWRYSASGSRLPWYESVEVLRPAPDQGWGPVISRVADTVRARVDASSR